MADRFARAFGSFLRRIIDMGDGTYSERVVAVPPTDMVLDGRLQVDAEMGFPPAMVTGDRLKVNLDEPIDITLPAAMVVANRLQVDVPSPLAVTLPAALVNANRLKVEVDDPIDVVLPAAMVVANRLQVDTTLPATLINANRLKVEVDDPIDVNLSNLLITGGGIAGISPRIRVDPGQTGFFAGRMFRCFLDGVIPTAGPSVQFRFTAIKDFILWSQQFDLTQGALQLEIYTGATPSGTWVSVPVIGVNRMGERPTPLYVATNVVETSVGGTGNFTGGTRVDVMKVRTSSTNGNASNVGGDFSERGLPAGVYYGRLSTLTGGLTVNDAAQYIYQIMWEERG
jgi:hypothetical protein